MNLLRHRATHTPVLVDGGGWAHIEDVAGYFGVDVEEIVHIARIAEKPRLQVFHAVCDCQIDPSEGTRRHPPSLTR